MRQGFSGQVRQRPVRLGTKGGPGVSAQDQPVNEINPSAQSLVQEVERLSGQSIGLCYHCHKCTAGCPVVEDMAYGPDRLLRMVLLGQEDLIYRSRDIWLCAGCYACAARCPNGIEIPVVMDALRQMAQQAGYPAAERDALLFHRLFLGVVKRLGRSHEAVMLGLFKVLSHTPLLNDMGAGLGLFLRGKVPILPERMGDSGHAPVQDIYKRRQ